MTRHPLKTKIIRAIRRYGRLTTTALLRTLLRDRRNARAILWRRLSMLLAAGVVRRTVMTRGVRVAVWELAAGN